MTRAERLRLAMALEGPAADLAEEAYFALRRGEIERCDLLIDAAIAKHREYLRDEEEEQPRECAASAIGRIPPHPIYQEASLGSCECVRCAGLNIEPPRRRPPSRPYVPTQSVADQSPVARACAASHLTEEQTISELLREICRLRQERTP